MEINFPRLRALAGIQTDEQERLMEEKWSAEVHTKWSPPEGFFTRSADAIAKGLHANSRNLKQAMGRLNFYINRAGVNLSDKDRSRLESAKTKLHKMYD